MARKKNESQRSLNLGVTPESTAKKSIGVVNFTTSKQGSIFHETGIIDGKERTKRTAIVNGRKANANAKVDTVIRDLHDAHTQPLQATFEDVGKDNATLRQERIADANAVLTERDTTEAMEKHQARKSALTEVTEANAKMTKREADIATRGKHNRTERAGSSVRVLNRIALHECGHGMNGGGTRKEVQDAGRWQAEFKVSGDQTGRGGSLTGGGTTGKRSESTKRIKATKLNKERNYER